MNTTMGRHHRPHTNSIDPVRISSDAWWAVAYASLLAALIAGEIAVNLVVAGAASSSQIATLRWSGYGAAILGLVAVGSLGVARRTVDDPRRGSAARRPSFVGLLVGLALTFEAGRAFRFATRLVHEVRLQRDEPLTALELGLNLVIALLAAIAIIATWWLVPFEARNRTREHPSASSASPR